MTPCELRNGDMRTDAELLCLRLVHLACVPFRRNQLVLFDDRAVWNFPLAGPGEPERLIGKAQIAEVMGPRWDAADAAMVTISCREVVVRSFADSAMACSQFELVVERDGLERVRRFAQIVKAKDGLIGELTEYG